MESSKEADKEDSQGNRSQATGGPQHRLSLDGANQQVQDSVSSGVANRERDHIQVPPSTQVPKASDSSDPKLLYESDDDRETAEREGDKPSSFAGCDDTPSDTRFVSYQYTIKHKVCFLPVDVFCNYFFLSVY